MTGQNQMEQKVQRDKPESFRKLEDMTGRIFSVSKADVDRLDAEEKQTKKYSG